VAASADAVVVGGGVIGCAIAYELARHGMDRIILLERSFLASGSTGRCAAGVRSQWGTEMNCRLAKKSISMFETLNDQLEYSSSIEFEQKGYLILAYTDKEWSQFRENVRLQNSLGIPSRLVSPQEARRIVPTLNTSGLLGATFCSKDGHCNPFQTTLAYAGAASRLGVDVRCRSEVTGIDVTGGRVTGVRTGTERISTPIVVNAAGAYAQLIAAMAGVDVPNYAERHQILVTEPVDRVQEPMVISFSKRFYCQQTPHGSFIMGMGDPHEQPSYDTGHSWQFLEEMAGVVCDVLPPLRHVHVVRQWSGLYDMTPDAQPVLGPVPQVEGFYMAGGFSGHGFMLGPVAGLVTAEMVLGLKTSVDVSMLDLGRFARGELVVEPSVV
jgi:sarcosine oxidase subunit beta